MIIFRNSYGLFGSTGQPKYQVWKLSKRFQTLSILLTLMILLICFVWLLTNREFERSDQGVQTMINSNSSTILTCHQICTLLKPQTTSQQALGHQFTKLPPTISKEEVVRRNLAQLPGGAWTSKLHETNRGWNCHRGSSSSVAILIPIRDRWPQLYLTLAMLIPLLQKQQLCYRLFVMEQYGRAEFNKGRLMNAGYLEARHYFQFDCVVFQDADLAPLNDRIPYGCDEQTKQKVIHLGVGLNSTNFKLLYSTCIGGVLKFSREHFEKVNGFSNRYWGWGQEDDDMEKRIKCQHLNYEHIDASIGQYAAIEHAKADMSKVGQHFELLKLTEQQMLLDGLNSIEYRVLNRTNTELFTHWLIDVGSPEFGPR